MKQIKQTKVLISLKKSKCVHCCFFIALKHWPFYLTRDKWTFTYSFTCPSVHVCVSFPSFTKHTSINLPTHPPPHTHPPFYTLTHLSTHCSVTPHRCLWVREASSLALPIEQGDLQAARGVGAVTKDQVDPPLIVFHGQDFCGDVQLHSQFQNSNSNQGPARKGGNNPTGTWPFPAFQGGGFLLDRRARLILPYLFHGCFHLPRRRKQDSERSNYMAKFAPQKGKCAKLGDPRHLQLLRAIKLSLCESSPFSPPGDLLTCSLWVSSPEGWWRRDDGRQGSAQGQVPAVGRQWFLCCPGATLEGWKSVPQVWSLETTSTQI